MRLLYDINNVVMSNLTPSKFTRPVYALTLALLIFSITISPGCSKYTVTTTQSTPGDIRFKNKVAASYLWGIINKPQSIVDSTCGTAGVSEVKVTSNLGYSLLNVATLGIVHIVKLEWKCQKEPPRVGF
jgi:hypothetical protein